MSLFGELFYSNTSNVADYGAYDDKAASMLEAYANILPDASVAGVDIVDYDYSYRETLDDNCTLAMEVKYANEDLLNQQISLLSKEDKESGTIKMDEGSISYGKKEMKMKYDLVIVK